MKHSINKEHELLEKRHEDMIDRQDVLAYKHGGEHVHAKDTAIFSLNVRGFLLDD
jgi:hypothetical protein